MCARERWRERESFLFVVVCVQEPRCYLKFFLNKKENYVSRMKDQYTWNARQRLRAKCNVICTNIQLMLVVLPGLKLQVFNRCDTADTKHLNDARPSICEQILWRALLQAYLAWNEVGELILSILKLPADLLIKTLGLISLR